MMSEKIINRTQKVLIIKQKTDKRCYVKVSIIHLLKEKKKRWKGKPECEKLFVIQIFDQWLKSKKSLKT